MSAIHNVLEFHRRCIYEVYHSQWIPNAFPPKSIHQFVSRNDYQLSVENILYHPKIIGPLTYAYSNSFPIQFISFSWKQKRFTRFAPKKLKQSACNFSVVFVVAAHIIATGLVLLKFSAILSATQPHSTTNVQRLIICHQIWMH